MVIHGFTDDDEASRRLGVEVPENMALDSLVLDHLVHLNELLHCQFRGVPETSMYTRKQAIHNSIGHLFDGQLHLSSPRSHSMRGVKGLGQAHPKVPQPL
jgi:hypothetical protein